MKKILSLLLAVIMVASLFPVMAFATDITTWADLQTAIDDAADGATITLTQDLTATGSDGALNIGNNKNIIINLNGKTLDRGLASSGAKSGGCVIKIGYGAKLTIEDSVGGGKITGGNNNSHGGGVYNDGTFTMTGGSITGNKSDSSCGGGVYNNMNVNFTMTGGSITGNEANFGGGVYNSGGTFTMTGGSITNNTAMSYGGGVYHSSNNFTMTGGSITNNTAMSYGGGVFASANLKVGGTAKVSGNSSTHATDGIAESNIHLADSNQSILKVSAEKPLTDGAAIGVTVWQSSNWGPDTDAGSYLGGTMNDSNYKYFFMTNSGSKNQGTVYTVVKKDGGYALSDGNTHKVTGYEDVNGNVTAETLYYESSQTVTLTVAPAEGYKLTENSIKVNDGAVEVSKTDNTTYTFTMPSEDVTVTAEFELIPEKEPEEPEPERRSYTTITIGDNKDKEETKTEEVKEEENPDTGAPVMNLGAVAVVLGAAYIVSKKH